MGIQEQNPAFISVGMRIKQGFPASRLNRGRVRQIQKLHESGRRGAERKTVRGQRSALAT